MRLPRFRHVVLACVLALVIGGSSGLIQPAGAAGTTVTFTAQPASYDLAIGNNARVLIGLLAGDQGLVAFGTVEFDFAYLGTRKHPVAAQPGPSVTAGYRLVAGFSVTDPQTEPRFIKPSQAIGVYAAENVTFDRAGRWRATVTVRFGDKAAKVPATFNVARTHAVLAAGDPAPRTDNPLVAAPGVDARSIDSRATRAVPAPDPALHSTSVAGALAAGLPLVVVVSTPTYCISRFCGPITDSVNAMASRYAGRVAFVHLEVWKNFQKQQINDAAAQWILPRGSGGEANEPWVFTVGRDGTIQQRFDNVTSDDELNAATVALVS